MWALMLFGVALFSGTCCVFNPVLKGIRRMGLLTAYGVAALMFVFVPWKVALATWTVFAAFGGAFTFVYELWARMRYGAFGRAPRPLVALQGFVLWPAMIPEVIEGILVDVGVLQPGGGTHGVRNTAEMRVPPGARQDSPTDPAAARPGRGATA
jgi:hypothetical protein